MTKGVKIDFSKFDKKIAAIINDVDKIAATAIKEGAEQSVKTIVQRSRRKGQDKDGKNFKPYSESYKEFKKSVSAPSTVNLTSAGQRQGKGTGPLKGNRQGGTMLNSLAVIRVEDKGTRRVISTARQIETKKLEGHVRGEGRLPVRNPMGFTKAEDEEISGRIARQIQNKIKKLGNA